MTDTFLTYKGGTPASLRALRRKMRKEHADMIYTGLVNALENGEGEKLLMRLAKEDPFAWVSLAATIDKLRVDPANSNG